MLGLGWQSYSADNGHPPPANWTMRSGGYKSPFDGTLRTFYSRHSQAFFGNSPGRCTFRIQATFKQEWGVLHIHKLLPVLVNRDSGALPGPPYDNRGQRCISHPGSSAYCHNVEESSWRLRHLVHSLPSGRKKCPRRRGSILWAPVKCCRGWEASPGVSSPL